MSKSDDCTPTDEAQAEEFRDTMVELRLPRFIEVTFIVNDNRPEGFRVVPMVNDNGVFRVGMLIGYPALTFDHQEDAITHARAQIKEYCKEQLKKGNRVTSAMVVTPKENVDVNPQSGEERKIEPAQDYTVTGRSVDYEKCTVIKEELEKACKDEASVLTALNEMNRAPGGPVVRSEDALGVVCSDDDREEKRRNEREFDRAAGIGPIPPMRTKFDWEELPEAQVCEHPSWELRDGQRYCRDCGAKKPVHKIIEDNSFKDAEAWEKGLDDVWPPVPRWVNSDPREVIKERADIIVCAPDKEVFRAEVVSQTVVLCNRRKNPLELISKGDPWPLEYFWVFGPSGW